MGSRPWCGGWRVGSRGRDGSGACEVPAAGAEHRDCATLHPPRPPTELCAPLCRCPPPASYRPHTRSSAPLISPTVALQPERGPQTCLSSLTLPVKCQPTLVTGSRPLPPAQPWQRFLQLPSCLGHQPPPQRCRRLCHRVAKLPEQVCAGCACPSQRFPPRRTPIATRPVRQNTLEVPATHTWPGPPAPTAPSGWLPPLTPARPWRQPPAHPALPAPQPRPAACARPARKGGGRCDGK